MWTLVCCHFAALCPNQTKFTRFCATMSHDPILSPSGTSSSWRLSLCFSFPVGSGPSAVSESSQAALQKTQWAESLALHFRGRFHVVSVSMKEPRFTHSLRGLPMSIWNGLKKKSITRSKFCRLCPASYLIEKGVCYLVLCEGSFPKKLAFAYLEDLQAEFHEQHGKRVPTVSRPYSFIEFGMTILF